jgi:hypothetical protein
MTMIIIEFAGHFDLRRDMSVKIPIRGKDIIIVELIYLWSMMTKTTTASGLSIMYQEVFAFASHQNA